MTRSMTAPARKSTVPNPTSMTVVPVFPTFLCSARAGGLAVSGAPGTPGVCGVAKSLVLGGVAEAGTLLGRLVWGSMTVYVARADPLVTEMMCVLVPWYARRGGATRSVAMQVFPARAEVALPSVEPSHSKVT